ncbi:MAG: hypothetical protein ACRDBL_06445 [Rhabdaerophilum sp.]|jgi:hypothetical protein
MTYDSPADPPTRRPAGERRHVDLRDPIRDGPTVETGELRERRHVHDEALNVIIPWYSGIEMRG